MDPKRGQMVSAVCLTPWGRKCPQTSPMRTAKIHAVAQGVGSVEGHMYRSSQRGDTKHPENHPDGITNEVESGSLRVCNQAGVVESFLVKRITNQLCSTAQHTSSCIQKSGVSLSSVDLDTLDLMGRTSHLLHVLWLLFLVQWFPTVMSGKSDEAGSPAHSLKPTLVPMAAQVRVVLHGLQQTTLADKTGAGGSYRRNGSQSFSSSRQVQHPDEELFQVQNPNILENKLYSMAGKVWVFPDERNGEPSLFKSITP
eukprot:bmy_09211T0